jgi:dihydroflavonol-4-reductase
MERSNVEGTRAFLDSAAATGIEKAVYVSTTVALGPAQDGENIEAYDGPYPSVYHRTKAEAHRIARAVQGRGLPLVIACPAYVYGPRDQGPTGRFIRDLLRKRVPGLLTDPGWFSFVHVDDVAGGLRMAGQQGQTGATYVFSGDPESMNGFAQRVTKLAGVRPPLLRFPPVMAALTGRVLDGVTRATGVRFPITREAVAATAHDRWLHSNARARHEFGWQPRSLDVGLPETVSWFQTHLN